MVSVRVVFCVIIYFAGIILAVRDKHKVDNDALVIVSLIFWTALMFIMCFE